MRYEWDENKRIANIVKHSVDFTSAVDFLWVNACITRDTRKCYSEDRYMATSFIGNRLFLMVFTLRGETVRIISLRKANKREEKNHENKTS